MHKGLPLQATPFLLVLLIPKKYENPAILQDTFIADSLHCLRLFMQPPPRHPREHMLLSFPWMASDGITRKKPQLQT